jgi:hypothetical protein
MDSLWIGKGGKKMEGQKEREWEMGDCASTIFGMIGLMNEVIKKWFNGFLTATNRFTVCGCKKREFKTIRKLVF